MQTELLLVVIGFAAGFATAWLAVRNAYEEHQRRVEEKERAEAWVQQYRQKHLDMLSRRHRSTHARHANHFGETPLD